MTQRATNGIRISHKEFIQDVKTGPILVTGYTPFTNTQYAVQPGSVDTFNWLAVLANNYTEYYIHSLSFVYRSTSATALNSTNTALGTVIMAAQYDISEPKFRSKSEMEATLGCVSVRPSASAVFNIDVKNKPLNKYLTRNQTQGFDRRQFYDFCNFQLATQGMQQANVQIGELWCVYDISFYKPVLRNIIQEVLTIRMNTRHYYPAAEVILLPGYGLSSYGLEGTKCYTNNRSAIDLDGWVNNRFRLAEGYLGTFRLQWSVVQTGEGAMALANEPLRIDLLNGGAYIPDFWTAGPNTYNPGCTSLTSNVAGDALMLDLTFSYAEGTGPVELVFTRQTNPADKCPLPKGFDYFNNISIDQIDPTTSLVTAAPP